MATIELTERVGRSDLVRRIGNALLRAWFGYRWAREQRRTSAMIAHLEPHLIRDIGLDPEDVREAVRGTWDEVAPVSYHTLLPRDSHLKGFHSSGRR
jgi:uncharacterized protein YjiS (DUF1127 family)